MTTQHINQFKQLPQQVQQQLIDINTCLTYAAYDLTRRSPQDDQLQLHTDRVTDEQRADHRKWLEEDCTCVIMPCGIFTVYAHESGIAVMYSYHNDCITRSVCSEGGNATQHIFEESE